MYYSNTYSKPRKSIRDFEYELEMQFNLPPGLTRRIARMAERYLVPSQDFFLSDSDGSQQRVKDLEEEVKYLQDEVKRLGGEPD